MTKDKTEEKVMGLPTYIRHLWWKKTGKSGKGSEEGTRRYKGINKIINKEKKKGKTRIHIGSIQRD